MAGFVLDLRPILDETLDITFSENNVLHIKKPPEILVQRMGEQMKTFNSKTADQEEQLAGLNALMVDVLNRNTDGKTIDIDYVRETLPLGAKLAIIEAYASFAMKLDADPNLPARPSRAKKADGHTRSTQSTP